MKTSPTLLHRQVEGILELLTSAREKIGLASERLRQVAAGLLRGHERGFPECFSLSCPEPLALLSEAGDLVSGVVMAIANADAQLGGTLTAMVLDLEEHSLAVRGAQGLKRDCGRLHLVGAAFNHTADRLGLYVLALAGAFDVVRRLLSTAGGVRGEVGHA